VSVSGGAVTACVFGVVLMVPSAWAVARPREAAFDNDNKGPAWVRNYNRAPGQKTSPLSMLVLGTLVFLVGLVLAVLGLLGVVGAIH
jgi:hypothetical protein